jgi:hypothetical protein
MDASRLGRGEMVAAGSAVVLFIVMFFGWFKFPSEINGIATGVNLAAAAGVDTSINAWQSYDFTDLILMLTIIVTVGTAISAAMARDVALPVATSALVTGLGILSFIFVGWSIINTPSSGPIDLDRGIWVFVGLVLTAGIAYGGWMSMQEEGTSFGAQADRLQGDDPPPPPPPPPAASPPAGGPPAGGPPAA